MCIMRQNACRFSLISRRQIDSIPSLCIFVVAASCVWCSSYCAEAFAEIWPFFSFFLARKTNTNKSKEKSANGYRHNQRYSVIRCVSPANPWDSTSRYVSNFNFNQNRIDAKKCCETSSAHATSMRNYRAGWMEETCGGGHRALVFVRACRSVCNLMNASIFPASMCVCVCFVDRKIDLSGAWIVSSTARPSERVS